MDRHRLSILTLLLLLASSCAGATREAQSQEGGPAPKFTLPDAQGQPVSLDSFADRVVIVDFWASWCEPCKAAMPFYEALQAQYGEDRLVILGISVDEHEDDMQAELQKRPVHFRILHDAHGKVAQEYGVSAMPSSYVIRGGEIAYVHRGFVPSDREVISKQVGALIEGARAE